MSTKKFLRFFLILTAIVIGAILIAGTVEPKDVTVYRSTEIKAPRQVVFEQMVRFKNWPNWSPWKRLDTSMIDTFTGTDGQTGSTYHWKGDNRKTGEAEIKNTSVNGTEMEFSFELLQPSQSKAKGKLKAEDSEGGTKATLSFTNHFDYPWNAMLLFMDLDKTMSRDLEYAMKNMKEYVEAHSLAPTITDTTAHHLSVHCL